MTFSEHTSSAAAALAAAGIPFVRGFALAPVTSFRIGGPADIAVRPSSEEELTGAVRILRGLSYPCMVVGRTTDLLFDDAGYRGAVLFTGSLRGVTREGNRLRAMCGETLNSLAFAAAAAGLTGLEFSYGIPGSVGGGVCMNAGAYGGEMADVLVSCRVYDSKEDAVREIPAAQLRLSYRHSLMTDCPELTVLSADFELRPGNPDTIRAAMEDYMGRRRAKQPLDYPSAGSVFKRPAPNIYVGRLIEEAGLKGTSVGGARISEKHAGFIVNAGGATAADVLALVALVQQTLGKTAGVVPECEIKFIPAEPGEGR